MTQMSIFRTTVEISALESPSQRRVIENVMVDTGSEYSWIDGELLARLGIVPVRVDRFRTADGRMVERPVGFGMVFAAGRSAPTVLGFGGAGDMTLLGAHALEGLNL